MIQYLGMRHDLTLVSFIMPGQERNRGELLRYCSTVYAVDPGSKPFPEAPSLPYLVSLRESSNMRNVLESIDTRQFDVALIEQIYLVQYAEHIHTPVILGEHNVESSLFEMSVTKGLDRLFPPQFRDPRGEADRLRAFEDRMWPKFAVRTAVSEAERLEIQHRARSGRTILVENGTDPSLWLPDARHDTKTAMFTGLMHYLPNVDALTYFLQEIWPKLLRCDQSFRFIVAGRDPLKEVRDVCGRHGITLIENPLDLRQVARQASLSVVPLRVGAGSRIKILDSMALGLPVVTTRVGCSGLAVVDNEHLLVRDDPSEFADAVVRALTDRSLWQRLRNKGRQLVEERYRWDRTLEPLGAAISDLARENRTPG